MATSGRFELRMEMDALHTHVVSMTSAAEQSRDEYSGEASDCHLCNRALGGKELLYVSAEPAEPGTTPATEPSVTTAQPSPTAEPSTPETVRPSKLFPNGVIE
jgi:hypothetical protein